MAEKWTGRLLEPKHQEVYYEAIFHRSGCLNKTTTTAISMDMLAWKVEFSQSPNSREKNGQLMTIERGMNTFQLSNAKLSSLKDIHN